MNTLAFFFIDPIYMIFVLGPTLLLSLIAQGMVKSAYAKTVKIASTTGMTGAQAASQIMAAEGITDVSIEPVQGRLSDHYDPKHKVLRLSPDVYGGRSLAALGIAAHEAGHALQHAHGYAPLAMRSAIVPMAGIGSQLGGLVVIGGLMLNWLVGAGDFGIMVAWVGVGLFAATVLFTVITLPVEFDASRRARQRLLALSMVTDGEDRYVGKVLNAAAMTYVAAMVGAVLNLLYYAMLVSSASRN